MNKWLALLSVIVLAVVSATACSKSSGPAGVGRVTGRFVGTSGPSGVTLPLPGEVDVHKSKASGRILARGEADTGGMFSMEVTAGKGYVLTGDSSLFKVGTPGHPCQGTRFNVPAGKEVKINIFCQMK